MSSSIFITGAAAGIGRAAAIKFAAAGWQVGLYDRDADGLEALQQQLGANSVALPMDVTNEHSVADAIAHFSEHTGGRMSVLFNSAGVLTTGPFLENESGSAKRMFDINVLGLMRVCRQAHPLLKVTSGARIVNMSSYSAIYGVPDFAAYSASKFAVRAFTEAMQIEWLADDIHVCDLMPAFVNTAMVANTKRTKSMDKRGVNLTPEQVADVAWQAATDAKKVHWFVGRGDGAQAALLLRLPGAAKGWLVRTMSGY